MRTLTLLIILVATAVVASSQEPPKAAVAQSDAQKTAANIIIGTEQQAWEAMKNKDARFFDANLSADSSMIGYLGVLGKSAAVNLIARMPCETSSHTLTDFKVTFFTSDTALVSYRAATDGNCFGKPIPTVWASAVYVKRGERWLKASHQETPALTAAVASSQEPPKAAAPVSPANPFTAHTKLNYGGGKLVLLRTAEQVPEEDYSFKPTDAVRSFGQIIGHIADAQYNFCSIARGEKNPLPNVEKTKTSKADLIAALKDAFAYCDRAYEGMNDSAGTEMVKLMGFDTPKLGVLIGNNQHISEHYGNLVTYMRLKNIVPPTSDPAFMRQMMQQMKK
ncbi:MAG: hypothetical protein QOC99_3708 [Acidobacteriota bacterium]|jgi:uncharacterized damage-inducible protein DinB|nr:hypothetical protein [Acidobacteriota bacterium]